MELIQPPGGNLPSGSVGTEDWNVHVRKEATMVFSYKSFRHWTSTRTTYTEGQRRIDRDTVINALKASEASLFPHMAMLSTQMGANLRAYHFLRNQEILGMKPVERITLLEVKEVLDHIGEWKWVSPAPVSTYLKHLPSCEGDLKAITKDFRGRKRLKALWDVTG